MINYIISHLWEVEIGSVRLTFSGSIVVVVSSIFSLFDSLQIWIFLLMMIVNWWSNIDSLRMLWVVYYLRKQMKLYIKSCYSLYAICLRKWILCDIFLHLLMCQLHQDLYSHFPHHVGNHIIWNEKRWNIPRWCEYTIKEEQHHCWCQSGHQLQCTHLMPLYILSFLFI